MNNTNSELFNPIQCLDKGFVRLVDYMGDDSSIVQAARVSYGNGTKTVNEDRGLIRYLMRHRHTTPFEMVVFKFHLKLPIFVARQAIRHRTFSVNEYSGRYSEMKDEFYIPELERLTTQSSLNKQGSSVEQIQNTDFVRQLIMDHSDSSYEKYIDLLNNEKLSRELARTILPINNYTEWYWKADLHNILHFLKLRADSHAQEEIRVYAEAMASIVKQITPFAYEAFEDYVINGVSFSSYEFDVILNLINQLNISKDDLENNLKKSEKISNREIKEFLNKIKIS